MKNFAKEAGVDHLRLVKIDVERAENHVFARREPPSSRAPNRLRYLRDVFS